jgi:hypothetical protein
MDCFNALIAFLSPLLRPAALRVCLKRMRCDWHLTLAAEGTLAQQGPGLGRKWRWVTGHIRDPPPVYSAEIIGTVSALLTQSHKPLVRKWRWVTGRISRNLRRQRQAFVSPPVFEGMRCDRALDSGVWGGSSSSSVVESVPVE